MCPMRLITWMVAIAAIASVLSISSPVSARGSLALEDGLVAKAEAMRLALNPQPEPPNKNRKNKIKKGDPNKPK